MTGERNRHENRSRQYKSDIRARNESCSRRKISSRQHESHLSNRVASHSNLRSRTPVRSQTRVRSRSRLRLPSLSRSPFETRRFRNQKDSLQQTLDLIMNLLDSLENRRENISRDCNTSRESITKATNQTQIDNPSDSNIIVNEPHVESVPSEVPLACDTSLRPQPDTLLADSGRILIETIKNMSTATTHSYFISNFDPTVHDIDAWCQEVDRAKVTNNWQDSECLSRVSNCLRGDARTWLNEWVTNDRT